MTSPQSIAIIGAGPAGLTLARPLQESNVELEVQLFEKDPSPTSRTFQGGSLDLHRRTGLAAIKAMGLRDEFQKHARYEGEELVFAYNNNTEFMRMKEATQVEGFDDRPEIDRETLKALLLENVNPESVRWGKHLQKVRKNGVLSFKDGTTDGPFDLVVGAEGTWSKVTRILADTLPAYSGIGGIESRIVNPNEDFTTVSKMFGRGSYFTFSDGKALMAQH